MKKIIIVTILISLFLASFLYFNYTKASSYKKESEILYFLQVAAFKKYENVTKMSKLLSSYLVIQENDLYHIYVGITNNKKNLKKLEEIYTSTGNNIYIKEKIVQNKEFLEYIKNYDFILEETEDKETILNINKNVLKKYEEVLK